jgi:hypothetical protein
MKYVLWIVLVAAIGVAGWRIIAPQFANLVFQDELQDTAAQLGAYTGVSPPASNEELRNIVIRKAQKDDIALDPEHVSVRRSGKPGYPVIFIAADYTVNVNLLVYSYDVHFYPTSRGGKF